MERLEKKDRLLIGITLFSMFFGAGNLIFPAFLGAQAGKGMPMAFIGFAVSAAFLPVLGVVAVTKSGGLEALASRVHPKFSYFYIMILYLAIGPCLAIPRTASTSFSIAAMSFGKAESSAWVVQLLYSVVFFIFAAQVAMHPEKLTEYLGKRLTPVLLTLILIIFAASVLRPAGPAAESVHAYKKMPAVQGLLDGYQTMDTLAALNFGMIIAMNIKAKGIKNEKNIMRETVRAGWIASATLFVVYGMLSYIGMLASQRFAGSANGTEILSKMVNFLFGNTGAVILVVIFVIACFNTCVSLLSCCGNYFQELFPGISYKNWVYLFAAASLLIANIGLDAILKFSVPILNVIYPLAILLIFLSCVHHRIEKWPMVYPMSMLFCGISSLLAVLDKEEVAIFGITRAMRMIPGYKAGFGWVIPAVFGILAGMLSRRRKL